MRSEPDRLLFLATSNNRRSSCQATQSRRRFYFCYLQTLSFNTCHQSSLSLRDSDQIPLALVIFSAALFHASSPSCKLGQIDIKWVRWAGHGTVVRTLYKVDPPESSVRAFSLTFWTRPQLGRAFEFSHAIQQPASTIMGTGPVEIHPESNFHR